MQHDQDFDILQSIYARNESLADYATRHGMSKAEAEMRLRGALTRQKSRQTFNLDTPVPPDDRLPHLARPKKQRQRQIRRYLDPDPGYDEHDWMLPEDE